MRPLVSIADVVRSLLSLVLMAVFCAVPGARGDEVVEAAAQIDQLLEQSRVGPTAPICRDEDFLRRVYLDLWGTIPSADSARAFLADTSPAKRQNLISALIAGPEHARHLAYLFDVWLMERRPAKGIDRLDWQEYLFTSFRQRKRYDQLIREILAADGATPGQRVRAKFLLDRDCDPHALVRDVGRLFLGRDLQCAQCHDHPLVDDYGQDEYYGLMSLLQGTFLFTDTQQNNTLLVGERAAGWPEFRSVFLPDDPPRTAVPGLAGKWPIDVPRPELGGDYVVAPAENVRPIPRYSPRSELARHATIDNAAFDRTIANRLWSHMFGKGLVDPIDMDHGDNPPVHPQLLQLLTKTVRQMHYDVSKFLAMLAHTDAYQRAIDPPARDQIVTCRTEVSVALNTYQQAADEYATLLEEAKAALHELTAARRAAESEVAAALRAWLQVRGQFDQKNEESRKAQAEHDQLAAQLAQQRTKLQVVAEAAEKSRAALEQLPEDGQVKSAADGLTAKSSELAQEVAELEKNVSASQQKLEEVVHAREDLRQQWTAAEQQVSAAYPPLLVAGDEQRRGLNELNELKAIRANARQQAAFAEALIRWLQLTEPLTAVEYEAVPPENLPATESIASPLPAEIDRAEEDLWRHWSNRFVVSSPRSLTPEQLAWSFWQATGQSALEVDSLRQEWDAQHPAPANLDPTALAERQSQRDREVRQGLAKRLSGTVDHFAGLFGGTPGQLQTEFHATADQALFLANSGAVHNLLAPRGGNLTARLLKAPDDDDVADELYLSILSRPPSDTERNIAHDYLAQRADRREAALKELVWGLLTAPEARFYR